MNISSAVLKFRILRGLARGRLCKEIADELDISVNTVNTDLRRIYEKLQVHSRAEAVAKYTGIALGHSAKKPKLFMGARCNGFR
ncbi:response regulator transcription factor [Pontiella desulfatans]|uniref:response regulator transcription factor n=1 Tax=Pontiella desulfatans TaxID=2750659 RepID=UPI00109CFC04|nr:helix-turn-helix transcriptional regulator [Pontiella desulfatans]